MVHEADNPPIGGNPCYPKLVNIFFVFVTTSTYSNGFPLTILW